MRHRKAILPSLVVIFSLFFAETASPQCGAGKISQTVQGFGSILVVDNSSASSGLNALGSSDGSGAIFASPWQYLIIDLIDTVRAGQSYSIIWRQSPGQNGSSVLNWSESLDGSTFVVHPSSGIPTTEESYFSTDIVASTDTRFLRLFSNSPRDLSIDAVIYSTNRCYSDLCGPGYSSRLLSGNALPVASIDQSGVSDYTYLSGVPDGRGALLNSSDDWVIIYLPHTIPAGQQYYIIWRPIDVIGVASSVLSVEESDGTGWGTSKKLTPYVGESPIFLTEIVTASQNTNQIRIRLASGSDYCYLDAIVFNALGCLPPPPDLDVSGDLVYCGTPLLIAPELTITDGADQIISSAYVQIGTGFQAGQDLLSFTTGHGITATYIADFGLLVLSGRATTSQYETVLRSLTYSNSTPGLTTGNREIIISLERYLPATGHYYRYVPIPDTRWHDAILFADRSHLFGMQGYLVTIGSAVENDFLRSQMAGGAVWVGASDFYSAEGDWQWVTGPDPGTPFWLGDENGWELAYSNWDAGEPNDYGDQDFCHYLTDGTWDDNGFGIGSGIWRPEGYYIEFGGMPGDPVLDISGTVNVNVITGTPPAPVISGPETVCPGATGVIYSTPLVPGHSYLWEVTGGTIVSDPELNSITVDWGVINPGTVKVTQSIGASCHITSAEYSVFIGDITDPVITGSIMPTTVEGCSVSAAPVAVTSVAELEAMGLSISDNCTPDASLIVTHTYVPAGSCPIVITRTYTITDAASNSATVTHTINIGDSTPPALTGVFPAGQADMDLCYSAIPAGP
ncbi:MAG: lectin-like protein, partial [Bacteroidales bacterium]|nr:lectin-like protein [Bacteroidales bacterium]